MPPTEDTLRRALRLLIDVTERRDERTVIADPTTHDAGLLLGKMLGHREVTHELERLLAMPPAELAALATTQTSGEWKGWRS